MRPIQKAVQWVVCTLALLLSSVSPSEPRAWLRNGPSAADYLVINDNRGNGEMVMVLWMAPPLVPPAGQAARDLLDKYVVVGVVHSQMSKDGTFNFDRSATIEVRGAQDEMLKALDMDTMPPAIVGTLAVLKATFSRSFGAFGQGMQLFVFDSGSVHACSKGGMSVLYFKEKYTYETPVPGCPAA